MEVMQVSKAPIGYKTESHKALTLDKAKAGTAEGNTVKNASSFTLCKLRGSWIGELSKSGCNLYCDRSYRKLPVHIIS